MNSKSKNLGLTLVLGGARSGKSTYAENLLGRLCSKRIYVATAEARDEEMQARITTHQVGRGEDWRTIEAPLDPVAALGELGMGEGVLLDCLTLWLSNQMESESDIDAASVTLLDGLEALERPVVMVSNELGMGLVPETALGRQFRDAQGRLNQLAAARARRVVFVAAGLPLMLKGDLA